MTRPWWRPSPGRGGREESDRGRHGGGSRRSWCLSWASESGLSSDGGGGVLQCREQSTAGDKPNWKPRLGKIECPKGPPGYDRSLWFLLCVRAGISQSLMNEMKQKRHTAWNPKRNHFLLFLTVRSKGLPEAASGLFPPLGTTAP